MDHPVELMPDIRSGTIQPGTVFDPMVALDDVPAGRRARAARKLVVRL